MKFHLLTLIAGAWAILLPGLQAQPVSDKSSERTLSMTVRTMAELNDEKKLSIGDRIIYRVIEDQDPPVLRAVLETGEVDVPYLGRRPAAGKTCKELAEFLKSELEKDLYKQATVLIALDQVLGGRGKIYVMGKVRTQGPLVIPEGEIYTVSKAILAVGGFTEFADERKVRLIRRLGSDADKVKEIIVDVKAVLEGGELEKDIEVRPGDRVIVKGKLFNI